jgi:hypothetical protein
MLMIPCAVGRSRCETPERPYAQQRGREADPSAGVHAPGAIFPYDDGGSHNIHEPPDPARTKPQHDALKFTLRRSGCEVIDVQGLPRHPNHGGFKTPMLEWVSVRSGII